MCDHYFGTVPGFKAGSRCRSRALGFGKEFLPPIYYLHSKETKWENFKENKVAIFVFSFSSSFFFWLKIMGGIWIRRIMLPFLLILVDTLWKYNSLEVIDFYLIFCVCSIGWYSWLWLLLLLMFLCQGKPLHLHPFHIFLYFIFFMVFVRMCL